MSNLLMIDDSPLEHLVMQKMLDRYELFKNSTHLLDGRDFIAYVKDKGLGAGHLPDLIFLDLNMPEFSGWDFLDQMAALYPYFSKPITVYILSSSVDVKDMSRAKTYPFVRDFYSKPIRREQLESLYALYCQTHRLAG